MEEIQKLFGTDFVQSLPDNLNETEYLRIKGPFIHNGEFILVFREGVERKVFVLEIKKIVPDGITNKNILLDYFSIMPSEFEWYVLFQVFSVGLVQAIFDQLKLIVSDGVSLEKFPGSRVFAVIGDKGIYVSSSCISQILKDPHWLCLKKYFYWDGYFCISL